MIRVAGTDPGTSSLDVLLLEDGRPVDQVRFLPEELQRDTALPARWLADRGPFDLVAGPSGYGLPVVRGADVTEADLQRMALVRPDDRGHGQGQGVLKFLSVVRGLLDANLPLVFLPGVIQLPTVPPHRKLNRVDLGTADKLCVAALALAQHRGDEAICVLELGSVFTAAIVIAGDKIVDGVGGSSGPVGWHSPGAWDGEAAYLFSPLRKRDLFVGGAADLPTADGGASFFRESVVKTVAGLKAITPFDEVVLSGRLLETEPAITAAITNDLSTLGRVRPLASWPGAWVKHAAQGAALLADGLAGGSHAALVDRLELRRARGSVLDWLRQPRADEVRAWFA